MRDDLMGIRLVAWMSSAAIRFLYEGMNVVGIRGAYEELHVTLIP